MEIVDVVRLALIAITPTLLGAAVVYSPRAWAYVRDRMPDRSANEPQPVGPPIEQLAADLRRLLRLHAELTVSAHLAMRAHRLWSVEAAIAARALEAAKALDVPHRAPENPDALTRAELCLLLTALSMAGLVLPSRTFSLPS